MFVYTKNDEVIKQLEGSGAKLLKVTDRDILVYALPPTLSFNFNQKEDTWCSDTFTF